MKATILAITLDTEDTDMVLAVPQLVQAVRASMPATNGADKLRTLVQLAPAVVSPSPAPAPEVAHEDGGVVIRPPAERALEETPPGLYTQCQDCHKPKPATRSPLCHSCAVKRGRRAARHNEQAA